MICTHCKLKMGVENAPTGSNMRKNVLQVVSARFLSGSSVGSLVDFWRMKPHENVAQGCEQSCKTDVRGKSVNSRWNSERIKGERRTSDIGHIGVKQLARPMQTWS